MKEKTIVSHRLISCRAVGIAAVALMASAISLRGGQPLAGVDGLGRVLLQHSAVGDPKPNRKVGIFYFLWMTDSLDKGCPIPDSACDLTEIVARHPEALEDYDCEHWGDSARHGYYFWGQPVWGYYRCDDEWVAMKSMQLLTDAGVDFLVFDASNGMTYPRTAHVVMSALDAIRAQGKNPPEVVFYTSASSGEAMREAWEMCYRPGAPFRHPDCWLYLDGKPLIVGRREEAKGSEFEDFFTFREPRFPRDGVKTGAWSWISFERPQHIDCNARGEAEMISVSVAQHIDVHAGMGGSAFYGNRISRGRSFRNGSHGNPEKDRFYGYNVQEQWDYALTQNVPFVFVTGWNEWIAGRWDSHDSNPEHSWFCDQASPEYSRDIEPTLTGGLDDHYYMQLVNNIRRYKGIEAGHGFTPERTVASMDDWDGVADTAYVDYTGDTRRRMHPGAPASLTYINVSGRNDIHILKNAWDRQYVYFYAETAEALTSPEGDDWMRLYLNADRLCETGWLGFDFRVVRGNTLQRYEAGEWTTLRTVDGSVDGRRMMIAVPREDTGMTDGINIEYKWADNMQREDPMDWYVNGDAAPGGRFSCFYHPAGRTHDILQCGADAGGQVDNSMLFERVIDALCFDGGGTVRVPAGRYRVNAVNLKANVELHLEKDAVIAGQGLFRNSGGSVTGEGRLEGFSLSGDDHR